MAANARGQTWSKHETVTLLSIWRDEDIEGQLQGMHRNEPIYARIAELLAVAGYKRTTNQCRNKVKLLKKQYTKAKRNAARSGTSGRVGGGMVSQDEYNILEGVLGTRPIHAPRHLVDTMATGSSAKEPEEEERPGDESDMAEDGVDAMKCSLGGNDDSINDEGRDESSCSTNSIGQSGIRKTNTQTPHIDQEKRKADDESTLNDFSKKSNKRRKEAMTDVLADFINKQEKAQAEFRQHEEKMLKQQQEYEKEYRAQEFAQNMEMMRAMMGMFSQTQGHPPQVQIPQHAQGVFRPVQRLSATMNVPDFREFNYEPAHARHVPTATVTRSPVQRLSAPMNMPDFREFNYEPVPARHVPTATVTRPQSAGNCEPQPFTSSEGSDGNLFTTIRESFDMI